MIGKIRTIQLKMDVSESAYETLERRHGNVSSFIRGMLYASLHVEPPKNYGNIFSIVEEVCNPPIDWMRSAIRTDNYVIPRQIAMWALHNYHDLDHSVIGPLLGRNRATSNYAYERCTDALVVLDPKLSKPLKQVKLLIERENNEAN